MLQLVLIGISAGAASALMFSSVASGSLFAVILFYLAPLPILLAAIGWMHVAGLIAAVVGAAALASIFGSYFFFAFLLGIGLPAWGLGYLTLLAKPKERQLEWFPPGQLVLWSALFGALVVVAAITNFGFDAESMQSGMRSAFERVIRANTGHAADAAIKLPGGGNPDRLLDVLVAAVPPIAAMIATLSNVFNLWLAARIVQISGRLRRPWPDLSEIRFPNWAMFALLGSFIGIFLPGLLGIILGVVAASLMMAFVMLGFSVLNGMTRHMNGRAFLLGGIYAAVIILGWPALFMILLALADSFFDFRSRADARKRPQI